MKTFQKYNRPFIGIILLSIILLSSSCMYDKEFAYINDQIIALNNRVARLQESTDQKIDSKVNSSVDSQINSVKANQADTIAEVDRLKAKIKELEGRVEDNEHIIKQAVEKDLTKQDSLRSDLDNLSSLYPRIEKLEILVRQQNEYLGLEAAGSRETGPEEMGREPGREPVQTALAEGTGNDEEGGYNRCLALFREEKYERAVDCFMRFLDAYPKSDLADNAQFWIGESYMALKQYEKAILAYQEVIKKYPKANKVPNAMRRQAMAWLEINDKTSARAVFKKLIKEFPNSSEAEIAQKKLNQLE